MRKIIEFKRREQKEVKIQEHKNIDIALKLIDSMIAGKRFGELDSLRQMYFLDCQCKIEDMIKGIYSEDSIEFLRQTLDSLINTFCKAKDELNKVV